MMLVRYVVLNDDVGFLFVVFILCRFCDIFEKIVLFCEYIVVFFSFCVMLGSLW